MKKSVEKCDKKCLKISGFFGRWGNGVTQIKNAVLVAKESNISVVNIPKNLGGVEQDFYWDDIKFHVENSHESKKNFCVPDFYFHVSLHANHLNKVHENLISYYEQKFKVKPIPNDTLVIHIRSGGIFINPHPLYAQPSCKFYTDVMKLPMYKKTIVVAEDEENPCVNYVIKNGGVWKRRSFKDDMRILFGAKNLMIGRGTIGVGIATSSKYLENLYTFNNSASFAINNQFNCIPEPIYYKDVIAKWKATSYQLELMKTAECEWKTVHSINSESVQKVSPS